MPGAAGFSAQGCTRSTTPLLPGAESGQQMEEKPPLFWFFVRKWGLTAAVEAATCRISPIVTTKAILLINILGQFILLNLVKSLSGFSLWRRLQAFKSSHPAWLDKQHLTLERFCTGLSATSGSFQAVLMSSKWKGTFSQSTHILLRFCWSNIYQERRAAVAGAVPRTWAGAVHGTAASPLGFQMMETVLEVTQSF